MMFLAPIPNVYMVCSTSKFGTKLETPWRGFNLQTLYTLILKNITLLF